MLRFDFFSVRAWFACLVFAAFGLIGGGLVIQSLYHLSPCPLCVFQRLLYVVLGVLAFFGLIFPRAVKLWAILLTVVGLGGVGVAGYQTWMQAFPYLVNECSYSDPNLIERFVDWLGMQWPTLFLATGFCVSRDWEFLGLSIANWSVLAFAGFVAVAILLLRRRS